MMSDLEKSGHNVADESPIVLVEREPSDSRHKLFRPTELPEEAPELTGKRSKAPAVSSVTGDVKPVAPDFPTTVNLLETTDSKDTKHRSAIVEKQSTGSASSGKHKHRVGKKSSSKSRGGVTQAENIPLTDMDSDPTRKEKSGLPAQPIPPDVKSITSATLDTSKAEERHTDEDITDEITEMRTPRAAEKIIDWSDDGEAGGLPRSDSRASRASRVSRAVRQLFCCGVAYSPASEDDISTHRMSGI